MHCFHFIFKRFFISSNFFLSFCSYEACLAQATWGLEAGNNWVETQSEQWAREAAEWAVTSVLSSPEVSSTIDRAGAARDSRASTGGIRPGTEATMFRGRHLRTVASTNQANATTSSRHQQQRQLSAGASLLVERQPWAPEAWAQWSRNYIDDDVNRVGSGSGGHSDSPCSAGSSTYRGFMHWMGWKHQPQSAPEMRSAIEACCSAHVMTEDSLPTNEEHLPVPPATAAAMNGATSAVRPHLRARVNASSTSVSRSTSNARGFTSAGGGADMHQHLAKVTFIKGSKAFFFLLPPLVKSTIGLSLTLCFYERFCARILLPVYSCVLKGYLRGAIRPLVWVFFTDAIQSLNHRVYEAVRIVLYDHFSFDTP